MLLVCRQYFSRVSNLGLKNRRSCLQSCSWFNSLKALPRFSQSSLSCFSLYGTENGLNLSFKNPFSLFLFFCFSGTMTFGEQNSLSQSFGLLSLAFHSGINFFDSAEMYVSFPLLLFLLGFLNLIWCHFWLIFEPRYPVPQRAETQGKSEELGRLRSPWSHYLGDKGLFSLSHFIIYSQILWDMSFQLFKVLLFDW